MGKQIIIRPEPGTNLSGTTSHSWSVGNHKFERIFIKATQPGVFQPYLCFDPTPAAWYAVATVEQEHQLLAGALPALGTAGAGAVWRKFQVSFEDLASSNNSVAQILTQLPDKAFLRQFIVQTETPFVFAGSGLGNSSGTFAVDWVNQSGTTATGAALANTGGSGGNFDAGANSSRMILSGDGYVEWTMPRTDVSVVAGFNSANVNQDWPDLDFAFSCGDGGGWGINESGNADPTSGVGVGPFVAGDVFRIEIEAGVVKYKVNGTLVWTSLQVLTYPVFFDTAIYHRRDSAPVLINAVISGADLGVTPLSADTIQASEFRIVGEPDTTNGSLWLSNAVSGYWGALASSAQSVPPGSPITAHYEVNINDVTMMGLTESTSVPGETYVTIQYGLHLNGPGIAIYENGAHQPAATTPNAVPGDTFQVISDGTQVTYCKNNIPFYTSLVDPSTMTLRPVFAGHTTTGNPTLISSTVNGDPIIWSALLHLYPGPFDAIAINSALSVANVPAAFAVGSGGVNLTGSDKDLSISFIASRNLDELEAGVLAVWIEYQFLEGANTIPVDASLSGVLDAGNFAIQNLGAPTVSTDAATKSYVDAEIAAIPSGGGGSGDFQSDGSVPMSGPITFTQNQNALGSIYSDDDSSASLHLKSEWGGIIIESTEAQSWMARFIAVANGSDIAQFCTADNQENVKVRIDNDGKLTALGTISSQDVGSSFEGNVFRAINDANQDRGAPILITSGPANGAPEGGPITLWTGGTTDATSGFVQMVSQGIKIFDDSVSGCVTIKHPPSINTYELVLPADQGTGALTNDGAGNLSWGPLDSGVLPLDTTGAIFVTGGPTPLFVSASYRWTQEGKKVTVALFIKLDQANIGFTYLTMPIPTDMPKPMVWPGVESEDSLFTGTAMTGDYSLGGYGTNGQDLFQIYQTAVPNEFGFYFYNPAGEGNKRDRIFAQIDYFVP